MGHHFRSIRIKALRLNKYYFKTDHLINKIKTFSRKSLVQSFYDKKRRVHIITHYLLLSANIRKQLPWLINYMELYGSPVNFIDRWSIKWEKKLLLVCLIFSCELSGHFNTQSWDKPECMWRGDSVQTHSSSAHLAANTFTEVVVIYIVELNDQHRKIMCVNLVISGGYLLKCHTYNNSNSKIFFIYI